MKRLTVAEKACKVIESLTSDDLSEDCECSVAFGHPITQKDAKALSERITLIYTIVHGIDKDHSCYDVHDDWRNGLQKLYRQLSRKGLIPRKKMAEGNRWTLTLLKKHLI